MRAIVPTTERLEGLENLDPLIEHLQGRVIGKIPEGASISESKSQEPDVLVEEDLVCRQADWNIVAIVLG